VGQAIDKCLAIEAAEMPLDREADEDFMCV
jgi:hypothetical protein